MISMTLCKDLMTNFNEYKFMVVISVYCVNLKNRKLQHFTIARFGHPASKSWPIPCLEHYSKMQQYIRSSVALQGGNMEMPIYTFFIFQPVVSV